MSYQLDLRTTDLDALLKTQLVQLCKAYGVSPNGLKAQLVTRLLAHRSQMPGAPYLPHADDSDLSPRIDRGHHHSHRLVPRRYQRPEQPSPGRCPPVGTAGSAAGRRASAHLRTSPSLAWRFQPHLSLPQPRPRLLPSPQGQLCPTCYTPLVVRAMPPPSSLSWDPRQSHSTLAPVPVLLPHCCGFTSLPLFSLSRSTGSPQLPRWHPFS